MNCSTRPNSVIVSFLMRAVLELREATPFHRDANRNYDSHKWVTLVIMVIASSAPASNDAWRTGNSHLISIYHHPMSCHYHITTSHANNIRLTRIVVSSKRGNLEIRENSRKWHIYLIQLSIRGTVFNHGRIQLNQCVHDVDLSKAYGNE